MSSDPTTCPSPEILADLQANRLPPTEAASLRRHITACGKCHKRATRGAADPFPFLEPGKGPDELGRLGSYSVRGILGAGGMAIVFDAYDESLQREVALKVMRPDQASPDMRESFLREARALASLPHEHIVAVYAVGEVGLPFIAMERLRGETLETRLQHEGSLPLDECLSFARQVAAGLAPAHGERDGPPRHQARQHLDRGVARRAQPPHQAAGFRHRPPGRRGQGASRPRQDNGHPHAHGPGTGHGAGGGRQGRPLQPRLRALPDGDRPRRLRRQGGRDESAAPGGRQGRGAARHLDRADPAAPGGPGSSRI